MHTITTTHTPVHPGAVLADELDARDLTPAAAATATGLTLALIENILAGTQPVNADTAAAFESAWGTPAQVWLNLQQQFDTHPKTTHGGRRQGAGRKASGLKTRLLRITGTPEQLSAIDAWLKQQEPGTAARTTTEALVASIRRSEAR